MDDKVALRRALAVAAPPAPDWFTPQALPSLGQRPRRPARAQPPREAAAHEETFRSQVSNIEFSIEEGDVDWPAFWRAANQSPIDPTVLALLELRVVPSHSSAVAALAEYAKVYAEYQRDLRAWLALKEDADQQAREQKVAQWPWFYADLVMRAEVIDHG